MTCSEINVHTLKLTDYEVILTKLFFMWFELAQLVNFDLALI